jgi:serine protease inhibitor
MRCHWVLLGAVLLLGATDVTSSYNVWKLARANGNFAFSLYRKVINGAAGENVFFSPFRSVTESLYFLQTCCVEICAISAT